MPKPVLSVSESSSPGLTPPFYMNGGLISSVDSMVAMQNLRGGIPGIPISGIMAAGFPHGFPAAGAAGSSVEDAKNGLSMLPMMLHGIPHPHGAAIPQHALFSVGTMMAHAPPPLPSSSSSSPSTVKVTTTTAPATSDASSPSSTTPADAENTSSSATEEKGVAEGTKRPGSGETAAVVAPPSRAHTSTGGHLTFNPFLIPGVSHGLLYPHMFLPHGGIMALPAMPPGAADSSPGSPKRRRKRAREDMEKEGEERESTVSPLDASHATSPSGSAPSTSVPEPTPPPAGEGTAEDEPSECQEPDSDIHDDRVTSEEQKEAELEDGVELDGQDTGEERQEA